MKELIIEIFVIILIETLVPILLDFIPKKVKRKKLAYNDFNSENDLPKVAKCNLFIKILFLLLTTTFIVIIPVLIYLFPCDVKGEELKYSLAFALPFGLPLLLLTLHFFCWKIEAHADHFISRNLFGKKVAYYSEIEILPNKFYTGYIVKKNNKKIFSLLMLLELKYNILYYYNQQYLEKLRFLKHLKV